MKQEQIDRRRKSVKYPYWWHRSYSLTEIYLLVQICFSSNEEIDTNDKKVKYALLLDKAPWRPDSNCIVQFPWNFSLLQLEQNVFVSIVSGLGWDHPLLSRKIFHQSAVKLSGAHFWGWQNHIRFERFGCLRLYVACYIVCQSPVPGLWANT